MHPVQGLDPLLLTSKKTRIETVDVLPPYPSAGRSSTRASFVYYAPSKSNSAPDTNSTKSIVHISRFKVYQTYNSANSRYAWLLGLPKYKQDL